MLKNISFVVLLSSMFAASCGRSPAKSDTETIAKSASAAAKASGIGPADDSTADVSTADTSASVASTATSFALPVTCRAMSIPASCGSDVGSLQKPIEVDGSCLSSLTVSLCAKKEVYFKVNVHPNSYLSFSALAKIDPARVNLTIMDPNLTMAEVDGLGTAKDSRTDSWALNYEMISWVNNTSASMTKYVRVAEAKGKATAFSMLANESAWTPMAKCIPNTASTNCYQVDQFPVPNSVADGYRIAIPEFAYLRREMIDIVMDAAKKTHALFPAHQPVSLLNMSFIDGSVSYDAYVRCARMGHVHGYDIDISYFQKDRKNDGKAVCEIDPMTDQCIPGTVNGLDRQATAFFITQVSQWPKIRFTLSDVEIIKEIVIGGDELFQAGKITKQQHDLLSMKAKLKDLVAIHYAHMHVQPVYDNGIADGSTFSPETDYLRQGIVKLQKPGEARQDNCSVVLKNGF